MNNEQIYLNKCDRSDDSAMDIDLIKSGWENHFAIASVVVRMDGDTIDSPDLVSFAERLVSRYNACAGMADPEAEIAELKRQRDELMAEIADISTVAHCGGVCGIGVDEALNIVRMATLKHWDRNSNNEHVKSAVHRISRQSKGYCS